MRAAVLGHPVAHSLSPVLHAAAHRALGLDGWRYGVMDTTEPQLPAVLAALGPDWAGLSLTMPLKRAVIPLLSTLSPLAAAVGAVNTVLPAPGTMPGPGEPGLWRGENTDVHGIRAAVAEGLAQRAARHLGGPGGTGGPSGPEELGGPSGSGGPAGGSDPAPVTAAVLGGGATAASALAALRDLGVAVPVVHVRSPLRAAALADVADRLGTEVDVAPWERADRCVAADVVVSTVPSGAADELAAALRRPGATGGGDGVLLDAVYDPWPTSLAGAWAERGGTVVGGATMLLHQAAEQVRLMTGQQAPLEQMRSALAHALRERAAA